MFKASLVASAVFAIAWFRMPPTAMLLRYFIFYGILIAILSMIVGLPVTALMERLQFGRWWSYLTLAAATGALLGALSSHPTLESCARPVAGTGEQETCIENPFAITFSPWMRSQPGFAENPSIRWCDYIGTIAFGAIVGGVLGISFWVFYRWRARSGIVANDPHFEATRKEAAPYLNELVAAHNVFWGEVQRRCRGEAQDADIRHFSAVAVVDHAGKITEFLPMPNNPHLRCYTAEMVGRVYPTPPMSPFYEQFEISVRERKAE